MPPVIPHLCLQFTLTFFSLSHSRRNSYDFTDTRLRQYSSPSTHSLPVTSNLSGGHSRIPTRRGEAVQQDACVRSHRCVDLAIRITFNKLSSESDNIVWYTIVARIFSVKLVITCHYYSFLKIKVVFSTIFSHIFLVIFSLPKEE